ncbi:Epn2 [Symbiodinium natans]|uniref:Epn2 protein n=1 Tax=Symbiodinium natans TaxID=878477 RepID=A0A812JQK9_9DINO|nr:Epn2 [Symbiodinium natans]
MLVGVWDQANETFSQLACMEKALDKLYGKLKHEAIKIKRQAKAVAELETPFERNLREATSNKRWGCPNSVLHELAIDSQTYKCRQKIMSRCFENLNGNQDKWRRILKTLILLEYLVKNAGDNIADELRGEQLTFRRLANFQCKDEGQDRGSGVREKAEALVKLLNDKDLLKLEREQAKLHHTKLTGGGPTAIVGGRGSQSTTTNSSVSSVLGDALNELRPGNDSRTLSASQAAELERRFNRLKEEQLAERAARERGYKTEGRATSDEAVGRAEAEDGPPDGPREDRFGLFDPRFAPQEGDSDSDGSPVRPSNRQAAPDVDLLDLDMEADARPPLSMPASDTILEDNSRASATPDWASFTAAQTPFCEEAPAAERGVDMASLMDLTSSTPTPSAPSASPLIPSFTETGSASAPDPFEGIEFKSAVASQRV